MARRTQIGQNGRNARRKISRNRRDRQKRLAGLDPDLTQGLTGGPGVLLGKERIHQRDQLALSGKGCGEITRIGQRLYYRDGRVTDLQVNTIKTQGATP